MSAASGADDRGIARDGPVLSLDAASQNVNSGGPNIYDAAIEKLELRKKTIGGRLKARWNRKFFVGNV